MSVMAMANRKNEKCSARNRSSGVSARSENSDDTDRKRRNLGCKLSRSQMKRSSNRRRSSHSTLSKPYVHLSLTPFTHSLVFQRFAHAEVTQTLLTYLSRYESFTEPEQMKRVVNLLHRQAVKAKAEGLFFKVSTLSLFKSILGRKESLPKEQPYKDLVGLMSFVLRKFFKSVEEDPFVLVEVGVYLPYIGPLNLMESFAGILPEEPQQMETILLLGSPRTRTQTRSRRLPLLQAPSRSQNQERIQLESAAGHRSCVSGG